MEHLEFFGLPSDPFQNDADARFYYESAPQKRARLRLLRGIHQRKGLAVLEGGPGLGKTTLAHVVLRALEEKDYAAHYLSIPHESCASGWLLPNVARAFGVPVLAGSVSQLVDQIHAQLVAITTARRAPVLLIDEAQLFRNREAMEEFRGLLNLSHEGRKLVSLVLFGLPELGDLLKLDPPLAQRVEVRVEMTAMDWLESQAYVSHRLRLAGATHPVFGPDALEALFRWSGGVPRVLNTLADNSIFEGFLTETRPIDSSVVQTAAQALGLMRVPSDSVPNIPPPAPAAPDLLAVTEITMPEEPAEPLRKPVRETMAVAKDAAVGGKERIERHGNEVHVYMTAIRSHFTPEHIRVKQGDKVVLHITNIERAHDATHGFAIAKYNVHLSLEPGESETATFIADTPGVFPYYCTEFCSALHLERSGYLLVEPRGS